MECSAEAAASAEPGAAAVVSAVVQVSAAVVSAVVPVSALDSVRRLIPGELNRCSPTTKKRM